MAAVSSPYGAQVISSQGGLVRPQRILNGIASGLASNIFMFQPVKMIVATGTIAPVAATTDKIWGIFVGCYFTPTGGRPSESPFWPSGAVYDPTYDMWAEVWPAWDPELRLRIQADGSVAQALLGSQFNFTNLANGSTGTGLSQCTVGAAGVTAGTQGQLFLSEFFDNTGVYGTIGDAFTDLICGVANPQVGYGPQTSIG